MYYMLANLTFKKKNLKKRVEKAEMKMGIKFPGKLMTNGRDTICTEKGGEQIPQHPRHRGLGLKRLVPITFSMENQWGFMSFYSQ